MKKNITCFLCGVVLAGSFFSAYGMQGKLTDLKTKLGGLQTNLGKLKDSLGDLKKKLSGSGDAGQLALKKINEQLAKGAHEMSERRQIYDEIEVEFLNNKKFDLATEATLALLEKFKGDTAVGSEIRKLLISRLDEEISKLSKAEQIKVKAQVINKVNEKNTVDITLLAEKLSNYGSFLAKKNIEFDAVIKILKRIFDEVVGWRQQALTAFKIVVSRGHGFEEALVRASAAVMVNNGVPLGFGLVKRQADVRTAGIELFKALYTFDPATTKERIVELCAMDDAIISAVIKGELRKILGAEKDYEKAAEKIQNQIPGGLGLMTKEQVMEVVGEIFALTEKYPEASKSHPEVVEDLVRKLRDADSKLGYNIAEWNNVLGKVVTDYKDQPIGALGSYLVQLCEVRGNGYAAYAPTVLEKIFVENFQPNSNLRESCITNFTYMITFPEFAHNEPLFVAALKCASEAVLKKNGVEDNLKRNLRNAGIALFKRLYDKDSATTKAKIDELCAPGNAAVSEDIKDRLKGI